MFKINKRYITSRAIDGSYMVLDTSIQDYDDRMLYWGLSSDQAKDKVDSLNRG